MSGRFISAPADSLAVGHVRDPHRVPGQGTVPAVDARGDLFQVDQQPQQRPLGGFPVTGSTTLRAAGSSPLTHGGEARQGMVEVTVQMADLRGASNRVSMSEVRVPVNPVPGQAAPHHRAAVGAAARTA